MWNLNKQLQLIVICVICCFASVSFADSNSDQNQATDNSLADKFSDFGKPGSLDNFGPDKLIQKEEYSDNQLQDDLDLIGMDLSDADAVIIDDEFKIVVNDDFNTKGTAYRKVKILTEKGKQYAQIVVPFSYGLETVEIVYAHTIRPDGTKVKLKDAGVYSDIKTFPFHSATQMFAMTMPAVEVGSILEYALEFKSVEPRIAGEFFKEIYLANPLPARRFVREIEVPKEMELNIDAINTDWQPDIQIQKLRGKKVYRWAKENLEPFKIEEFIPSYREVLPSIRASTMNSWDEVGRWWFDLIKDKYRSSPSIEKIVKKLTKDTTDDEDKLVKIFNFVKNDIRYVGLDFGRSVDVPNDAANVLKEKYGDCKDQTVLLVAMLREAGISSKTCLIRTKGEGPLNKSNVTPTEFDHVITVAKLENGKEYFLDPTAEYYPVDYLPYSIENVTGLLVGEGGQVEFVTTPLNRSKSEIDTDVQITIDDKFNAKGVMKVTWHGDDEAFVRNTHNLIESNMIENYATSILVGVYPSAVIEDYQFSNLEDKTRDLLLTIKFKVQDLISEAGDFYTLKPYSDSIIGMPQYLTKARNYPIKMLYPNKTQINSKIFLPNGLTMMDLPKPFHMENEFINSSVNFDFRESTVLNTSVIESKSSLIGQSNFDSYKSAWQEIIKAHRKQILLKALNAK